MDKKHLFLRLTVVEAEVVEAALGEHGHKLSWCPVSERTNNLRACKRVEKKLLALRRRK